MRRPRRREKSAVITEVGGPPPGAGEKSTYDTQRTHHPGTPLASVAAMKPYESLASRPAKTASSWVIRAAPSTCKPSLGSRKG